MLFTKAEGRDVMDLETAETVGTVASCTVAPSPARITALRLRRRGRGHRTLHWPDVRSFGPDAVAVEEAVLIREEKGVEPEADAHPAHDPLGKVVLTETGAARGTVVDLEFDEESGRVVELLTEEERIPGEELLGVGGYAVVVAGGR
ncbi:PRC-barrel domain-containing protein [Streptomyces sp. MS06]|uniref:PRC-barrel domain-containing protein n=1 Tax=Streptomyces sp. MS06 TaxID=3385974 RepID=UPI0039A2E750